MACRAIRSIGVAPDLLRWYCTDGAKSYLSGMPHPFRFFSTRWLGGMALLLLATVAVQAASSPGFDPVAATDQLINSLPADQRARSDAYFEGGYWLQLWDLVVTFGLMWILYRTGIVVWLRNRAEKCTRNRYVHGLVFFALYVVVLAVLSLPWSYYVGFVREHAYGLSNLTLGGWLGEQAKGLLPEVILGSLVGSLLYLALRRFAKNWWAVAGVVAPFLMLLLMVIVPVFISPLFNTYKPLEDPAVRDPILSLARANGVPAENVYEFDASKQTKRISANVSGALGTIRISLNDNLLNRCSPAEVKAVMAHELGHYVLHHSYELVINFSLVIVAGLLFVRWFFVWALRRWGAAWGIRDIADFAGWPLFSAAFALFMFLATPVTNTIIRSNESEADIFGLNAAREPDAFASVALKLAEYRKLSPGKWEERLLYDHPSGRNRILMSMRWKAENLPPAN